MANKVRKTHKGSNGTGESLTVLFDRSDPAERRALEAARLLAAKHGRRKSAIIALLEAVYAHYEATGELLSAGEISGALMGQGTPLGRGPGTVQAAMLGAHERPLSGEAGSPARTQHKRLRTGGIEITSSTEKSSAETVAINFLSSMKGLASGFFD